MTWWAWMIGGAILLGAELTLVDAQFYLVFVGGACWLSALAMALWPLVPSWVQWAVFGAANLVLLVGFRDRVYRRLRAKLPEVAVGPSSTLVRVPHTLAAGASCLVEYAGSHWTARNEGPVTIPADTDAQLIRIEGLILIVRAP